jgi:choline dehydrogenase-like flavoprotein
MGLLLAFADTDHQVGLFSGTTDVGTLLWGAIGLDGVITLVLIVLYVGARRSIRGQPPRPAPPPSAELNPPERLLRRVAIGLAALFALGAAAYEVGPLVHSTEDLFVELPFVTNSAVKVAALALLSAYAVRDLPRNIQFLGLVIAGTAISVVTQTVYAFTVDLGHALPVGGGEVKVVELLVGGIVLDGVILALLLALYLRAWRARYHLQYLRPLEYRTLAAAADVLVVGEDERVDPGTVARSMDGYMAKMRARRRWIYRLALVGTALRPLLALLPPLPDIEPGARRDWLKSRFERPRVFKTYTRAGIRVCQQLSYAGYYNNPETFASVGYQRFTQRPRFRDLPIPDPKPHPLSVEPPSDTDTEVCIVGSGAGGSILAYELAKRGHDVLVLERGQYVEPREFTEDEVEMMSRLYEDGLMQQTMDFRFTVLQGECVGGSTTVNNAVCFDPPPPKIATWNETHNAGIDPDELSESVEAVRSFLGIVPQPEDILNPSAPVFTEGVANLGLAPDHLTVGVVSANIDGCFGSGYCNMGCPWGKKLSMLETALPWAQRKFPGKVRVMADCEVTRIRALSGEPQRVLSVRARSRDGLKVTIKARRFVLSAGAVGSSHLMLRSGVGRSLPVGKRLCFNMGAPLTAELDHVVNAYDGLQISHFGLSPDYSFAYETWWNPPVAQAENMPGWFERHYANMCKYNRLMAVGALVGTEGNARVRKALTGGADIAYTPASADLEKMSKALRLLAEILFAGGAKRVMLNTWGYDEFTPSDDLDELERVAREPGHLTLGTGHPQGGNPMSRDPRHGVVGPDFRVHGYENLYVCDASVFPTSLTVNPQLTVMGMAHYAAEHVAAEA